MSVGELFGRARQLAFLWKLCWMSETVIINHGGPNQIKTPLTIFDLLESPTMTNTQQNKLIY